MIKYFTEILKVAEDQGWSVNDVTDYLGVDAGKDNPERMYEFCQYSPAGEDFFFTARGETAQTMYSDIFSYWQDFDVDEHVRYVMDMRGAPSISTLVDDARDIHDMIADLIRALIDYEEEAE